MKCPACSEETSGETTCARCGAVLSPMKCRACQAPLAVGVRACSNCGARARASSFKFGLAAGAALGAAVAAGLLLPGRAQAPAVPVAPAAAVASPAAAPAAEPEPRRTPREEADHLFNVSMAASEQGDAATLAQALPLAIAAYQALGALDDDASFHLAQLHLAGGDHAAARATAEGVLAHAPSHLLALSVGAKAAAAAGDAAAVRGYSERLVAAYDAELARPVPEYRDHARTLPAQLEAARKALGK